MLVFAAVADNFDTMSWLRVICCGLRHVFNALKRKHNFMCRALGAFAIFRKKF